MVVLPVATLAGSPELPIDGLPEPLSLHLDFAGGVGDGPSVLARPGGAATVERILNAARESAD